MIVVTFKKQWIYWIFCFLPVFLLISFVGSIIIFLVLLYILFKHIATDKKVVQNIQVNTCGLESKTVKNIQIKQSAFGRTFRYENLEFRVLGNAPIIFKQLPINSSEEK